MSVPSLRWSLVRYLLIALIPALLFGSAFTFYVAASRVRDAFDFGLLDHARDIAHAVTIRDGLLTLELPPIAEEMLKTVNEDRLTYAVWDESGHLIAGKVQLFTQTSKLDFENFRFDTLHVKPRTLRIVVLRSAMGGHTFYVAVGQTTSGMVHIQRSIFAGVFLFGTVLIAIALIGMYFGVRKGLKPITRLRREIASRSQTHLAQLDVDTAPAELQPIIHNLNGLMSQLELALNSHRHFIADAAHQLRTPLAALFTQVEVAQQLSGPEISTALQEIARTTQRTSHVANQLLSLARLEHAQAPHSEQLDINTLFSVILPTFVKAAERNDIELEFDLQSCSLHGNRILLEEMLSNLLDNAIRYVGRGGHVKVEARTDRDLVKIAIIDNGPGIDETVIEKLGTPFFRASKNNISGCGLGLAIAGEIVQLHRGSLHFLRASPQGGLHVDIVLPLSK